MTELEESEELAKSVYCVFCGKRHLLSKLQIYVFFETGTRYYCGKEEIARSENGRLFYWNGREFEEVR